MPSRHGVHLPHDSRAKKRTSRQQARTMSVVSSITTIAPGAEHRAARTDRARLERQVEVLVVGTTGPSAPPGMNALSSLPSRMPPQYTGA